MNGPCEQARDEERIPDASTLNTSTKLQNAGEPCRNQQALYLILVCLVFERIAFYSIASNLTASLGNNYLEWNERNVLIAELIFTGTSYLSTLIFAIISDAKLGRAKTILLGFTIYTIGFTLAILTTHPNTHTYMCKNSIETHTSRSAEISDEQCAPMVLTTIIVIALGAGAVQSNMAVLGAEQIRALKITPRYFDQYMLAVNTGGAIAKLILSLTHKENDNDHYYIAYIVALTALVMAVVLFLIGWRHYIHVEPYDSVITNCIPVIINAFQTRRKCRSSRRSIVGEETNSSKSVPVNAVQTVLDQNESTELNHELLAFLDFAKAPNGGKFNDRIVNDVKSLRSAIGVFILFIPYFITYSQVNSTFPLQGQHMNTFGEPRLVTWISLVDPATIIIGIILLRIFYYKDWNGQNKHISIATKFIIGMIFASITMFITGSIEMIRQHQCNTTATSNSNASDLSVYTQIPQYMGIGLSEIFAMIATYEFAYYAARRSAKSLFMSLRFCLLGIVSFVGALGVYVYPQITIQKSACQNEKRHEWALYTYFFVIAGLQSLSIVICIMCRKKFRIIELNLEN